MDSPVQTAVSPCATCGACCRSHLVPVSGQDVWRLSTSQRLGPEEFCVLCPEAEPRPEAFLLQANGQRFSLALDKKGRFALTKPCIFLMELPNGLTRCGVYDHRPAACRAYPMSLQRGGIAQQPESLCPPDAWPAGEEKRPRWAAALRQLAFEQDVYARVVARWNARVTAHPGATFTSREFFGYLLNVYDRFAQLDQDDQSTFLTQARQIVDSFYPHTPRSTY